MGGVLLRSSSSSRHDLLALDLKLLQIASVLHLGHVSAQHAVHVLEFSDFLVAQAAGADADSQAERTEPVLFDVFMGVGVFEAAEAVLPSTDEFVIFVKKSIRILA